MSSVHIFDVEHGLRPTDEASGAVNGLFGGLPDEIAGVANHFPAQFSRLLTFFPARHDKILNVLTNGELRCKSFTVKYKFKPPNLQTSKPPNLRTDLGDSPRTLQATFEALRGRLTCFLMLVLAIFSQRTVSLVWLARHAPPRSRRSPFTGGFSAFLPLTCYRRERSGR